MSHETILKMIEAVDPTYTAKLDEIDSLNWFWLEHGALPVTGWFRDFKKEPWGGKRHTRSRDALKAVRPKGWLVKINQFNEQNTCEIWKGGHAFDAAYNYFGSGATEELAELHAIIQAIAYERKQKESQP